jgi:hypothetical protein
MSPDREATGLAGRFATTSPDISNFVKNLRWRQIQMTSYTSVLGKKVRKGGKMRKGSSWRLVAQGGKKRAFAGTLLSTFNLGHRRIAVFSVPKD